MDELKRIGIMLELVEYPCEEHHTKEDNCVGCPYRLETEDLTYGCYCQMEVVEATLIDAEEMIKSSRRARRTRSKMIGSSNCHSDNYELTKKLKKEVY